MAEFDGFVTVPVVVGFDHARVIGELRVRRDALPQEPIYHFAIGYRALDAVRANGSSSFRITKHELIAVSLEATAAAPWPDGDRNG